MPHNVVTERRELWPCTDDARRMVEELESAAFNYGELPPHKVRTDADLAHRYQDVYRAREKLVRYVSELERLAGVPGVWMLEANRPMSASEAKTVRRKRQAVTRSTRKVANGQRKSAKGSRADVQRLPGRKRRAV